MLIYTARLPRRRLALAAAAAALLCCCLAAVHLSRGPSAPVEGTSAEVRGIWSNRDRIDYLASRGWQVLPDPVDVQELLIPREMDESYAQYLDLQHSQGFDLSAYAGTPVMRYAYEVTNYPTGESGVQVNLLVARHRIIGGEVLSPSLDGFLHGLDRPPDPDKL